MNQRIYVYDADEKSAHHPKCKELPWPISFHLGTHSRKHVFVSKRTPCLKDASRCVQSIYNKLRWMAFFHDEQNAMPWYRLQAGEYIKPCAKQLPPEVMAFTNSLRRRLIETLSSALQKQKGKTSWWNNTPVASKYAKAWLKRHDLKCMPTDKDGGFCLLTFQEYNQCLKEKLDPEIYTEVPRIAFDFGNIINTFCRLVTKWAKKHNIKEAGKYAVQMARKASPEKMACKVVTTMKTHKKAGKVGLRIIHSSVGHPFAAFSKMVSKLLMDPLSKLSHLCESTA